MYKFRLEERQISRKLERSPNLCHGFSENADVKTTDTHWSTLGCFKKMTLPNFNLTRVNSR